MCESPLRSESQRAISAIISEVQNKSLLKMKSKKQRYLLISICTLLTVILSCKGKVQKLEIKNENFYIKKELTNDLYFKKHYNSDFILEQDEWYFQKSKKPFMIVDHTFKYQTYYDKKLFDENLLDTPKLVQSKINDSTYVINIIADKFPIQLMSLIGWTNIGDVTLIKETKFNSYQLILNTETIRKDSIPFLTFKFYDPNDDRMIKAIERIPLNFNNIKP